MHRVPASSSLHLNNVVEGVALRLVTDTIRDDALARLNATDVEFRGQSWKDHES